MKSKIYQKISRLGFISSIVTLITCIGCNTTKNIPENDALYTGASINIISSQASSKENKVIKESLQGLTRPKPNSRLFGIPFKLGIYNMAGKGNKGLNKILKNWGEPPVLLSQLNLENNVSILTNSLENRGFFHASVVGDTVVEGKKASAKYDVKTREQYTINDIFFPDDSGRIYNEIRQSASNSLLQKGKTFNLEVIKGERLRIDAVLKEKGFFYFNPEHLLILVDSTIGNDQVNLYVEFKADVPLAARERYFINDVYIYSDYSLNEAANDTLLGDTVSYRGYNLIARKHAFKPQVFDRIMMFSPQDIYNRTDHNTTLARLINLGTFKFVKNRFELLEDSTALNAYYYLTPQPKKSLSVELGGLIKSNNATGSEISLKWRNRNTFRGAELLTVSTYFGTEVQFSSQNSGVNITRYGAEANLTVPRFVLPIFRFNTSGSFVPRTNFQLGYDVLQRSQQYTLNSFRAQFGYVWKENVRTEHRLNPIAVTFVQPLNVTREYDSTIQFRPILQRAIEKQFILGSNYNFNYNQLVDKPKNSSGMYFNGIVDLSGNIAGLIKRGNVSRGDTAKIFNLPFSQYVKTEADFRYYQRIGLKTQLANRVIFGLGLPYGNSDALPFSKQFFIGGNNSLRGFRSRSVGPGTDTAGGNFNSAGGKVNQIFADKTGDIKLEFNTELRIPLNNIFSTAVFADAGNVWLYNRDTRQPGGKFSKEFLKELAVDAGVGLRIDITILLLRLDLAVPLRKPFLPEGQRWVMKDLRFGDVVYNLAIGYPF